MFCGRVSRPAKSDTTAAKRDPTATLLANAHNW